jgi:putative CocE/NonD family hydrolase
MERGPYDVTVTADVMVPMRDGVSLATDIYQPAGPAERPVVLLRTPYGKHLSEEGNNWSSYFASHGYVAVVQDCRGCHRSEGEVDFLWPESDDGVDTIAWIQAQEWCDGRVATHGTSWCGWTQTAAAAGGADGMTAMVVTMSGARAHQTSVRHHGALELRFMAWAFWHSALHAGPSRRPPWVDAALNSARPSVTDWLSVLPLRRGDSQLALVEPYERWLLDLATRSDFDERWAHPSVNPIGYVDRFPGAATLLVGGWYDSYARATFQLYEALAEQGLTRVLMGPWTHGTAQPETSFSGDVEFGPDAALPSFAQLHLDWYDEFVRHEERGLKSTAPIRLFVMGGGSGRKTAAGRLDHGGRWRDEHEWPPARTRFTPLYLHGDGALRADAPAEPGSRTDYDFDPARPVPTIGGNLSSLTELLPIGAGVAGVEYEPFGERLASIVAAGGWDQTERPDVFGSRAPYLPLRSRADVLVFETPVLEEPVEVTGPITVELWVSSDAPDTDFTAKLIDAYPPSPWYPHGYALNLTDSIVRLRYRDSDTAQPYEPGTIVPLRITLYPTSNLFAAGHRIRLDVSSSNFPRFDVNPNTGDPLWKHRRRRIAQNTIHHSATYPSHVRLPIIPAS